VEVEEGREEGKKREISSSYIEVSVQCRQQDALDRRRNRPEKETRFDRRRNE